MLGTKWPSITSTWTMVAPPRSAASICSPSRVKSAERMDGAISIMELPPGRARGLRVRTAVGVGARGARAVGRRRARSGVGVGRALVRVPRPLRVRVRVRGARGVRVAVGFAAARVRVLPGLPGVGVPGGVRVGRGVRVRVAVRVPVGVPAAVRVRVGVLVERLGAALLAPLLDDGLVGRPLALFGGAADDDGDGLARLDDLAGARRLVEDTAGLDARLEALGALADVEAGAGERLLAVEVGLVDGLGDLYVGAAQREVDGRDE